MSTQRPADPGLQSSATADPYAGETHEQHVARLFRENNQRLVRLLHARLHSWEEAREVAQEAYVQLLGLHHTEAMPLLRNCLFKTAVNLARNRRKQHVARRRNDELLFFESDDADERSPERVCAADRDIALFYQALNELPPNCREAFRLVRLEGLSYHETAKRLGLWERQITRYVARALAYCLEAVESGTTQGGRS